MVLTTEPHYEFNAGAACLNFVNTVWERVGYLTDTPAPPQELLLAFSDLLAWAKAGDLLPAKTIRELDRISERDPAKSQRVFREALRLRETIFQTCLNLILDRGNKAALLEPINKWVSDLPPEKLVYSNGKIVTAEFAEDPDLSTIQTTICRDFMRLLCTQDLSRLRVCAADDCGWVFLDTSKSGRRKWCTMSDCGNRDKVNRFLERQRES